MNKLVKVDFTISDDFVEDIKALIVEGEFNARWVLIETYHEVGRKILEECEVNEYPVSKFTEGLSVKIGRNERTLWHAIKFYKKYPDINKLPEGKNISWNKIVTKYLTAKNEKECEHNPIIICSKCRKVLSNDPAEWIKKSNRS